MRTNNKRNVRKTIKAIKTSFIALAFVSGFLGFNSYNDTVYTMNCEVVEVNSETISIIDSTNNIWNVYADGFSVGDNIVAVFNNNRTDSTRLDDEIINLR